MTLPRWSLPAAALAAVLAVSCTIEDVLVDVNPGSGDSLRFSIPFDSLVQRVDTLLVDGDTVIIVVTDTVFTPGDTVVVSVTDTLRTTDTLVVVDTLREERITTVIDTITGDTVRIVDTVNVITFDTTVVFDTVVVTRFDTVIQVDTVVITATDTVVRLDTVVRVDTVVTPPPSLNFEATSLALQVGETKTVNVTMTNALGYPVAPSSLQWFSADPLVASVSQSGAVTGRAIGLTGIVAVAADQGLSSRLGVEVRAAEGQPRWPNEPAGMNQIFWADGTASVTDEFVEYSTWLQNVSVVSDATNPVGTGRAIEIRTPVGVATPNHAAAVSFPGGPWKEWYVSYWIYYDPNYETHGHKLWYGGTPVGSRSQGDNNATQWYVTRELDGASILVQQNTVSTRLVQTPPGSLTLGVWHHLEFHLIAESAPGVGDGVAYYWFDGRAVSGTSYPSPNRAVTWTKPEHLVVGFDGFFWQQQSNNANTREDYVRVGELYISGKK